MVKTLLFLIFLSLLSSAQTIDQDQQVDITLKLKFLVSNKYVGKPNSGWLYLPKRSEVLLFDDNRTYVFSFETGGKIRELPPLHIPKGHDLRLLSPDETKLVTYGFLGKDAELWNISQGNLIVAFPKRNKEIDTVAWDSNSGYLIFNNSPVYGEKEHEVFDAQTGRVVSTIVTRFKSTAQFSPDGRNVITRETDTTYRRTDHLKLWNAENGGLIREFPLKFYAQTVGATFSPDGKYILVSDSGKSIYVIDANSGETLKVIGRESDIAGYSRLLFSPDGHYLLINRERWRGFFKWGEVWFEVYETGSYTLKSEIRTQRAGKDQVEQHQVVWRPDSKMIASAGDFYQKQYGAECWDIFTGKQKFVLSPLVAKTAKGLLDSGYDDYDRISFSADSRLLITANFSQNNTIRIWNAETGKLLKALDRMDGYYGTTPDNKYVTKIDADERTISFYELVTR